MIDEIVDARREPIGLDCIVASSWDGLGMRANASAPMVLEDCEVAPGQQLTDDGAGFKAMLEIVLPLRSIRRARASSIWA